MAKRKICFVYETWNDLVNDTEIFPGLVAIVLGETSIGDKPINIYRMVTKDDVYHNGLKGEFIPLANNSKYMAELINSDKIESKEPENETVNENKVDFDMLALKKSIDTTLKQAIKDFSDKVDNFINSYSATLTNVEVEETKLDPIVEKDIAIDNEPVNPSDIKNIYKEDDIRIIQLYSGIRYIIDEHKELTKFNKTISLTEENSWLIPDIISITDNKVDNIKVGTASYITCTEKSITFEIDFTKIKKCAINY